MIRAVAKIIVAVLILHATARAGWTTWQYYQLKDSAREVILFGAGVPPDELADRIHDKAIELDVPLERQDIQVTRDGDQTFAEAFYTDTVTLVPGWSHPVDLSISVDAMIARPATAEP